MSQRSYRTQFLPFDPATKVSEGFVSDSGGRVPCGEGLSGFHSRKSDA